MNEASQRVQTFTNEVMRHDTSPMTTVFRDDVLAATSRFEAETRALLEAENARLQSEAAIYKANADRFAQACAEKDARIAVLEGALGRVLPLLANNGFVQLAEEIDAHFTLSGGSGHVG